MPKINWREFLEGDIKITEDATRRSKYREIRNRAFRMMEDLTLIAEVAVEPEHAKYLKRCFDYEASWRVVKPMMAAIRLALHTHSRERELIGIHWGRVEEGLARAKISYDAKRLYDKHEVDYRLRMVDKLKRWMRKTGTKLQFHYDKLRPREPIRKE